MIHKIKRIYKMTTGLSTAQFNELRKELKKLGSLTTSGVLKSASNPESKLHILFEWNDNKAAEEYRKNQARQVIKRYNISVLSPGEKIVHIPDPLGNKEGEYKEASTVVQNISDFDLAMDEVMSKLKSAQKSVDDLGNLVKKESPSNIVMLSQVKKGLHIAEMAIGKIH